MQVRIITDLTKLPPSQNCVNVIPYGIFGEINFRKQLDGSSKDLVNGGRISKRLGGITLIGAQTDNCSLKRKSVLVYESGKLLSICDMNEQTEKYAPAFGYKIITFSGKKIGILVDKDLYFPDAIKSLIFCDCCAIINLYAGFLTKKASVCAEFYSFIYGSDFMVLAKDKSVAFNSDGESILINSNQVTELSCEKRYKEVRIKRRGARLDLH